MSQINVNSRPASPVRTQDDAKKKAEGKERAGFETPQATWRAHLKKELPHAKAGDEFLKKAFGNEASLMDDCGRIETSTIYRLPAAAREDAQPTVQAALQEQAVVMRERNDALDWLASQEAAYAAADAELTKRDKELYAAQRLSAPASVEKLKKAVAEAEAAVGKLADEVRQSRTELEQSQQKVNAGHRKMADVLATSTPQGRDARAREVAIEAEAARRRKIELVVSLGVILGIAGMTIESYNSLEQHRLPAIDHGGFSSLNADSQTVFSDYIRNGLVRHQMGVVNGNNYDIGQQQMLTIAIGIVAVFAAAILTAFRQIPAHHPD